MLKLNIFRQAMLASCISMTISGISFASDDYDEDMAFCGHKHHDSVEMRDQAATRTYWEDTHAANPESWVKFKILGFNDFHGQLESSSLFGRPVGGAAVLASYLQAEEKESKNGAILVHAGDHVGASPPISALLQDEPSISFLNMLANKHCGFNDDEEDHKNHTRSRIKEVQTPSRAGCWSSTDNSC